MTEQIYILKYKDGNFVKVDDSVGPMSSGGYPHRVNRVEHATLFNGAAEAIEYGTHFWNEFEKALYPLSFVLGPKEMVYDVWVECNHNCVKTSESTSREAKHFLDCPVWAWNQSRQKHIL